MAYLGYVARPYMIKTNECLWRRDMYNENNKDKADKLEGVKARIDYKSVSPGFYNAMLGFEKYLVKSKLEEGLMDLVKIRASQINGCAWCLDMHTKDAIASGESPQRLFLLDTWEESPQFTKREKAALKWTEAVTLVTTGHVDDETFEEIRKEFNDLEIVELTAAVIAINAWNRANIAFRTVPGNYISQRRR